MKHIQFTILFASILILASCGQTRFTQKKYLNLKPIEEVKTNQEVNNSAIEIEKNQSKSSDVILTEELPPASEIKESTNTIPSQSLDQENGTEPVQNELSGTKLKDDLIQNQSRDEIVFPSYKKANASSKIEPFIRDGIILTVIEVVLFLSAIAFFVVAFTFGIAPIVVAIVILGIMLLMIATGIIAIIKAKKGLDSKDKSVQKLIFSIATLVTGILSIVAGIILGVNGIVYFLFE